MGFFPIEVDDDGTPRAALDHAGQGVRAFNHRSSTRFRPDQNGWQYPSDAYRCLGEVTYLLGCLNQVFEHLAAALGAQQEAGHIAITDSRSEYHEDPARAVAAALRALENSQVTSQALYQAVADAQSAINAASYCGPALPHEDD